MAGRFGTLISRLAVLFAVFASAVACAPRLTRDQFELPKHAALLLAAALLLNFSPGLSSCRRWLAQPAALALLCVMGLACLFSPAPLLSLLGENENLSGFLTWLIYIALFMAGSALDPSARRKLGAAVLLAAAANALYAVLQQAGLDPFRGEFFRHVRGFSGNPDFFSQHMAMVLPFALLPALSRNSPLHWAGVALLALGLGLSAGRGGILAASAGALALVLLARPGRLGNWRRAAAAVLLIGTGFLAGELLLSPGLGAGSRFASLLTPGGFRAARGSLWEGSARAARARPLLGWGPDTLKLVFPRYAPARWASTAGLDVIPRNAHCEPLNFLAICGALGLGCYLWLLACGVRRLAYARAGPELATAGAAVTAYLVHNLVGFGTAATAPLFWLLMGQITPRTRNAPETPAAAAGLGTFAFLGLALCLFAAVRFAADAYAFRGNEGTRHASSRAELSGFSAASRLAPWDPLYAVRRGWALEKTGRLEEAVAAYRRGLRLAPSSGLNLGSLGRAEFQLARLRQSRPDQLKALGTMRRAVSLAPSLPTLYSAAILAADELGRKAEAEEITDALARVEPEMAAQIRAALEERRGPQPRPRQVPR